MKDHFRETTFKVLAWIFIVIFSILMFASFTFIIVGFLLLLLWILFVAWAVGMPLPFDGKTYRWFSEVKESTTDES